MISQFDLPDIDIPNVEFEITCSKGTYIRSIAHDIGAKLNNGGHLTKLRRDKIGSFELVNAKTVEEWSSIIQNTPVKPIS